VALSTARSFMARKVYHAARDIFGIDKAGASPSS